MLVNVLTKSAVSFILAVIYRLYFDSISYFLTLKVMKIIYSLKLIGDKINKLCYC